jgi:hypothetical protein
MAALSGSEAKAPGFAGGWLLTDPQLTATTDAGTIGLVAPHYG